MARRPALAVALAASVVMLTLIVSLRHAALDSLYFFDLTSDDLVHTIPIEALRAEPIRSLWWAHAYPHGMDVIRGAIAWALPAESLPQLLRRTDQVLVVLWALQYGALVALVWSFLRESEGWRVAAVGAIGWMLHPGAINYASLLDSSQLTALVLLALTRQLWRLSRDVGTSVTPVVWSQLALISVRAIVQWPFVVLTAVAMALVGTPGRRLLRATGICLLVALAWVAKQYVQFGWATTSTTMAANLCRSIGVFEYSGAYFDLPPREERIEDPSWPLVLTIERKIGGEYNHYHGTFAAMHREHLVAFIDAWREASWSRLWSEYHQNLTYYVLSHRSYFQNHMIDSLPRVWPAAYDLVLTGYPLVFVIASTMAWWMWRHRGSPWPAWRAAVGIMLPASAVAVMSILGEKGENMRFRFFIEPVLWVFLVTQTADLYRALRGR